jgi:cytochrome c-type biogenesis protein CcmE
MKSKMRFLIGGVLILGFGVLAFLNFNKTIAPYVPFAEARTSGSAVQVAGFPDHQHAKYDPKSGRFTFDMKDEGGDAMTVVFSGVKPGNFDQAEKVVVVGRYHEGTFEASQILVKCPSKYQDMAGEDLKDDSGKTSGTTEGY